MIHDVFVCSNLMLHAMQTLSLSLPLAPFLVLLEILLAFSLYSNRADISSKVVRTKPSLILDVTCRNRSVKSLVLLVRNRKLFFFLMSKIVKKAVFSCVHQFLLLWSCLCFKGPQSFWRKDSGVTEGTPSLGSGCCSVSRQKPWTGACLVSSASCLSHSSAHVRCSTPTWQQDWLTYKYPFDHFIPIQLGIVAGRICGGSRFLCKGSWCKFSWRPETVMHCVFWDSLQVSCEDLLCDHVKSWTGQQTLETETHKTLRGRSP